jgi:hypothetical protein
MYPMIGTTGGGCSELERLPVRRALRSVRAAARVVLVLACASPLFRDTAIAESEQPQASTNGSAPSGLVAVIKDEPQNPSLDLRALDNPYISGVALQIHWNDIEAVEGKPDWSKLDALFDAAKTSNKWVQLSIFPGFFTPAWALEGVKTDRFAIQYGPGTGTVLSLPMPWNGVYLGRWFAFLKRLGDRYGTSPAFKVIAIDGPTSVSDEATLPKSPPDLKRWQSDGFRPSKYLAAWRETLKVYAADFLNQYVSLSLGRAPDILDIDDEGKIHPQYTRPRMRLKSPRIITGNSASFNTQAASCALCPAVRSGSPSFKRDIIRATRQ